MPGWKFRKTNMTGISEKQMFEKKVSNDDFFMKEKQLIKRIVMFNCDSVNVSCLVVLIRKKKQVTI